MARTPNKYPKFSFHKASGQAVAQVRQPDGTYRKVYLGAWGSPEAAEAYSRLCAEIDAGRPVPHDTAPPARVTPPAVVAPPTVAGVVRQHAEWAEIHYRRKDGMPTGEANNYRDATKPLVALFGPKPAHTFTRDDLKAVRKHMIAAGLARTTVNSRVGKIVRVFKWAGDPPDGPALVPDSVYSSLAILQPLQAGRTEAPETEEVKPVSEADFKATLPKVNLVVRDMLLILWHSGMRPGEVCRLKPGDVDRSAGVWLYRPGQHKTLHRGGVRIVPIGPKAQAVLLPWLDAAVALGREYVFPPSMAGQGKGCGGRTGYQPHYNRHSLNTAIRRACDKAGVPRWSANQLRHAAGTRARERFGLEGAQRMLGHKRASTTEIYAESSLAKAIEEAREIG
jgi:integrase